MAEITNAFLMIMANTSLGGTSSRLARAADLPVSEGIDDDPHRDGVGNFYRAFLEVALGREHRRLGAQRSVCLEAKGSQQDDKPHHPFTRDEPVRPEAG